ncbi:MAG: cyclase family protein [Lachnospiraceae bacterium]
MCFPTKPDGYSVADIPLEKCINLVYEVVRKRDDWNYIDTDDIKDIGKTGGAVLLCTGFDQYFNTEKYGINPLYLTVNAARLLMERGVVFVGIDAPLIDDMNHLDTLGCPVHSEPLNFCNNFLSCYRSVPKLYVIRLISISVESISTICAIKNVRKTNRKILRLVFCAFMHGNPRKIFPNK